MTIQNLCRTCFRPSKNMFAIYGSDVDAETSKLVLEVLQAFVGSPVRPADHASHNICNNCLKQILSTHSFMIKCRQSDMVFRQLSESHVHLKRLKDPSDFLEYVIDEKIPESKTHNPEAAKDDEIVFNGFFNNENPQVFDLTYGSDNEMQSGEEQETSDDILQCPACPGVFGAIKVLRTHLIEVHTMNSRCIMCDNEYFEDIWHHTRLHVPRNQVCDECGRKFILKSTLSKHSKNHSDHDTPFSCKLCFMTFETEKQIDDHTDDFHKVYCRICCKSFRHRRSLTRHKKIHQRNDLKCEICWENFSQRDSFEVHMAEHYTLNEIGENYLAGNNYLAGENDLVGEENSFANATKSVSALEHPEMFGNDLADKLLNFSLGIICPNETSDTPPKKLYPCEVCPKEFRDKTALTEHMTLHTGERPFSCSFCNKSFRVKRNLLQHLISHSKETPYICGVCKKQYKKRAILCAHLRCTHGLLNFLPCGVCDEKLENTKELIAHWKYVHKLAHKDVNVSW